MPALTHPLPIANGDPPNIHGDGEGLVVFLAPINDPWVQTRMGEERLLTDTAARPGCRVTEGERYTNARSGWVQGRRYLWTLDGDTIVGALNVTLNKEAGRRKPNAVVSNIFVHPQYRRQGIASALIGQTRADFPALTVDSALSTKGAALFLGNAEPPTPSGARLGKLSLPDPGHEDPAAADTIPVPERSRRRRPVR